MVYPVLDRSPVVLSRVSPGPLGKKFFIRPRQDRLRSAIDLKREPTLVSRPSEPVLHALQRAIRLDDGVLHRNGTIRLVVGQSRSGRHQRQRYHFPNEHDRASDLSPNAAFDVKTQVDFLEISMEERRYTE